MSVMQAKQAMEMTGFESFYIHYSVHTPHSTLTLITLLVKYTPEKKKTTTKV